MREKRRDARNRRDFLFFSRTLTVHRLRQSHRFRRFRAAVCILTDGARDGTIVRFPLLIVRTNVPTTNRVQQLARFFPDDDFHLAVT